MDMLALSLASGKSLRAIQYYIAAADRQHIEVPGLTRNAAKRFKDATEETAQWLRRTIRRENHIVVLAEGAEDIHSQQPVAAAIPGVEESREVSGDAQYLSIKSPTIKTLADALAHADVDPVIWDVDRYLINSWEMACKNDDGEAITVPLWQIKVWLKRRISHAVEDAFGLLCDRMQAHTPTYAPVVYSKPTEPHLFELGIYDHHFGKLSWRRETGEDYDLAIAEGLYAGAVDDLLQKAHGFAIERILLPVGQDLFHIDNLLFQTTKGTDQDVDGRYAKIIETGTMAVIHAIDRLLQVAPVDVMYLESNHDMLAAWHTARYLQAWYRNCPDVTVDTEPLGRKHLLYGVTLLGFAHRPQKGLPLNMAVAWPDDWAQSRFREWHTGHLHKKKETEYVGVEDQNGVTVKILPTLSKTEKWSYDQLYASNKIAEAYLFSRERGPTGYVCSTGEAV